ncbi:hypothetical protein PENSUB_11820 [Penicillium subrubescens]|uniref:TLDc domain-containing protein n=1 Tax=Penicillium subrubescens TaxID=1316194 RepID=A0A1Q5T2U0_9EURO|nr:hypothetical protein PENSUB_11820 [Penicillium subrubescens]
MLPGGVTTQYVDRWVAQGLFTPEKILDRFLEQTNTYNINTEGLEATFNSVATEDETGIKRVDEKGFTKLLTRSSVLPKHLADVGSIIFRSLHYLSIYPFRYEHPSALTLSELTRALLWLMPYDRGVTFESWGGGWCEFSPADHRRLIFQSLATERNGHKLPHDADEWRREARRRAYDLPDEKIKSTLSQLGDPNYDDWGDELYHDLLSVVMTAQPKRSLPLAGEPRDAFRPLALRLHGETPPRLYEFTMPTERLRDIVRLMLYHSFGINKLDCLVGTGELDEVADCVTRTFAQYSDVGINWPMFDKGYALHDIISSLLTEPSHLEANVLKCLHQPGKLFKTHILFQLNTIFKNDLILWFEYFKFSWNHDIRHHPVSTSELAAMIEQSEDRLLILVSGKGTKTQDKYLLGMFIPSPKQDCHRIQPKQGENWPICSLFELSPIQSVFEANLECPTWTLSGDEISFGDPENGVALVLKNGLGKASFTQSLNGRNEPIQADFLARQLFYRPGSGWN